MKPIQIMIATVASMFAATVASASTPLGPITYQGLLSENGSPANGTYDVRFQLYDAEAAGSQIGVDDMIDDVPVVDGVFTVRLNDADEFGAGAFDGQERWLQIEVNGTAITPRQPLTAAPYALFALNAASGGPWALNGAHAYNTNAGNVGIGTNAPEVLLHVEGDVRGAGRAAFGNTGIFGADILWERIFDFSHRITDVATSAFYWNAFHSRIEYDPTTDPTAGLLGHRFETVVPPANDRAIGSLLGLDITCDYVGVGTVDTLRGAAVFASGTGVVDQQQGLVISSDGRGDALITSNRALEISSGHRAAGGGITDDYAIYVRTPSRNSPLTNHYGLYLQNQGSPASFPTSYALYADGGQSYFKDAVGIGINAPQSPLHISATQAVTRMVTSNHVSGSVLVLQNDTASPTYLGAINFQTDAGGTPGQIGYLATHDMTFRVNGAEWMRIDDVGNVGIGTAAPTAALHVDGGSDTAAGGSGGYVVTGNVGGANLSFDNNEIMARNNGAAATLAINAEGGNVNILQGGTGNVGIGTSAPTLAKVEIDVANQRCIYGTNNSATFASAYFENIGSGPAGVFDGNVTVIGSLSKSSGSFRIDHPLDPANKYLYHSFVESPDMKNLYDGVVVTDERGYATIEMPDWFEPLNRDFRYQLTVVDADDGDEFVLAKIVREIADRTFTIRTSRGGAKVSWQVTGTRHDPWAETHRIPVEEEKPAHERGRYQHPELYGLSAAMSISAGNCVVAEAAAEED